MGIAEFILSHSRRAQPILRDYGVADRIVFNIKGNDFRLVTSVDFEQEIVWGGGRVGSVSDLP